MSDPPLSDINFKNKMALVLTTFKCILYESYHMNLKSGVEDGSVLQLVEGRPNPERNQEGNVVSPAAANLKQLSTLTRNIKECVRCAQRDIEPNQRNRYDTPEEEIPEEPCKFTSHYTYLLLLGKLLPVKIFFNFRHSIGYN